jgi:hypothetical protein
MLEFYKHLKFLLCGWYKINNHKVFSQQTHRCVSWYRIDFTGCWDPRVHLSVGECSPLSFLYPLAAPVCGSYPANPVVGDLVSGVDASAAGKPMNAPMPTAWPLVEAQGAWHSGQPARCRIGVLGHHGQHCSHPIPCTTSAAAAGCFAVRLVCCGHRQPTGVGAGRHCTAPLHGCISVAAGLVSVRLEQGMPCLAF